VTALVITFNKKVPKGNPLGIYPANRQFALHQSWQFVTECRSGDRRRVSSDWPAIIACLDGRGRNTSAAGWFMDELTHSTTIYGQATSVDDDDDDGWCGWQRGDGSRWVGDLALGHLAHRWMWKNTAWRPDCLLDVRYARIHYIPLTVQSQRLPCANNAAFGISKM